jgi:arabinogalactan oligomer/maltooligosaccharide transport system permease protein
VSDQRGHPSRPVKQSFGRWFRSTGWRHLVAWLALAFALFPVWWVIGGAFSDSGLSTQKVIPDRWTLDNFRELFDQPFWTWFRNSMVVGVMTALGTVLLCALAAFAFSRLRFRGRRPGLLSLLLIQMFPNTLAVVAIYLIFIDVDELFPGIGIGTIWSIILVYLGGALGVNTWLMKGFFDTLPIELDESAKVDGATHVQVFYKVILPLATPVLAVIGLLSFIITQAEFLIADTLSANQSSAQTLAAGLSRFVLGSQFDTRWGPFAAGALIGAVPVVVLFLFLQRFIVSGLTSGAVKG